MRFGRYLRELRERNKWLLREVAAKMDMDTALLSKIERSNRIAKREQISVFAEVYEVEAKELEKLWLADQIIELLKNESSAQEILERAEIEMKKLKK